MFRTKVLPICGLLTSMRLFLMATASDNRTHCSIENLERLLKVHAIIPDLIKVAPRQCVYVEMNGKLVNTGDRVDYLDTLEKPNRMEWKFEDGYYYSLIMTGLDVPTRQDPNNRESQQWLVGNIPGNNITAGDDLFPFQPAGMEYAEGMHRVAFVVFEQSLPIKFTEMELGIRRESVSRAYFSTEGFSEKYKLGPPIAVNFYEFDIAECN